MSKDRIKDIGRYIIEKGEVTTDELAKQFNVSLVTIRRDLKKLEDDNLITKIYGGAKARSDKLQTFQQREMINSNAKNHIASIASKLIKEGDRIFIDSGTTTKLLLENVNPNIRLTIFTNSLASIVQASKMPNVKLFVVGNSYNNISGSFTYWGKGPDFYAFNIDKAFMSTSGLTIKDGLTNKNPVEQEIKNMVCKLSDKIILLVDQSKIDKSSLMTYADLKDIDILVTDKDVSRKYKDFFLDHNIKFYY